MTQFGSKQQNIYGTPESNRRKVTLTCTYEASLEDIWHLWTTKAGLESWWGPEGFTTQVRKLDLRPGGELLYAMTATAPAQIEFMKRAGMPLTTEARVTYTEVSPMRRLAYVHSVDFIPGVEAYDIATVVEFHAERNRVRMIIHLDAMHSDEWTQRAVAGWDSQLSKVDKLFRRVEED
ncbi:MAG TPA: SRPBCC domain-containing protein [Candidatus Eremiobacteraceae bacterium]|jgi:uncharacterized protein YndB with AHSA1/START domain|nr:SRPBCC domain-containing protein [Candidatus Eremiobacteraceae bacterium]